MAAEPLERAEAGPAANARRKAGLTGEGLNLHLSVSLHLRPSLHLSVSPSLSLPQVMTALLLSNRLGNPQLLSPCWRLPLQASAYPSGGRSFCPAETVGPHPSPRTRVPRWHLRVWGTQSSPPPHTFRISWTSMLPPTRPTSAAGPLTLAGGREPRMCSPLCRKGEGGHLLVLAPWPRRSRRWHRGQ